jgi:hypothetical protein
MPKFHYVAMDKHGKETKGILEVDSQNEAFGRVKEMGLFPTRILEEEKLKDLVAHQRAMSKSTIDVRIVGYWKNEEKRCRRYPKPQWLVQHGWHAEDLDRIIAYLRSGKEYLSYMGYSQCRFEDCQDACARQNGVSDITDGKWIWPQGLAHYIEKHSVILPEEFIDTMRSNHWQVPQCPDLRRIHSQACKIPANRFWLKWARKYSPWYYHPIFWWYKVDA